jgi:hypothetical protein
VAACTFDACEGGLLNHRDGDRRSSYGLRHTYATKRLEKSDVNGYDLSIGMGCKVKQIETHYSHVVSKQRRQQITRTNRKKGPVDTGQGAAMHDDVFMAEAMRRYKAGELSAEAFLAITKSK